MINTTPSGLGTRSNLLDDSCDNCVSLWGVASKDELEDMAHKENITRMQAIDRHEHALAQEMAAQQWAEFLKIRARA